MKAIRIRSSLIVAAVVGLGAAIALALPAGAAVNLQSQSPPVPGISLGDTATLEAKGAAVFVPVQVTCSPGAWASINVQVTQNVGGGDLVTGSIYQYFACTGSVQQMTVTVIPNLYTPYPPSAFKKGVAFGQASLYAYCCQSFQDAHEIRIK